MIENDPHAVSALYVQHPINNIFQEGGKPAEGFLERLKKNRGGRQPKKPKKRHRSMKFFYYCYSSFKIHVFFRFRTGSPRRERL